MVTTTVVAVAVPALAQAQATMQLGDDKNAPVNISAERMTGRPDREVEAERNVEIVRGATTITSDKAKYRMVEGEVEASGNIKMKRYGDRYTGDSLLFQIDTGAGFITNPTYHLQKNNAQGAAERIDFESRDMAVVSEGSYSTCEGPDPDWYLKSSKLRLDKERDIGNAGATIVYFKGLPILGTPLMSFPLSDARKSGILPPTVGSTNKGGLEVMVPYYFNIAPNYDLTVYPKFIAKRGLQLGAEGRYLGRDASGGYYGETRIEFLNDRDTRSNRYAYSSQHFQTFDQGRWTLNWNLNGASDDNYPIDFARTITAGAQRLQPRDASLTYSGNYWNAVMRMSDYQVLQDPLAPIGRPYGRLPQLTVSAARQDVNGFDWSVMTEATRFWQPVDAGNDALYGRPNLLYPRAGNRLVVNPKLSYPILRPGYFVTPQISLHATSYSLDTQTVGAPSTLSRVLPTLSVDSGLVFERDANLFGKAVTQTLEPRLFYVYTPYKDQSQFPLFDTGEADFNYGQLFSENRFVGQDRISDANQMTAALVSRIIEPSGIERARFAVGQRYYFNEQRVSLLPAANQSRSDLLMAAYGKLTNALSAEVNMQYSQSQNRMVRSNYGVRWQPAPMRVLNLQYRSDVPNKLKQIDVSGQWPIAQRLYGVGRVNYSMQDKTVGEALAGLEYKADCWVLRLVAQRTPTSSQTATTGFFIQLELNGLSRIGSNPLDALRSGIPGYQMINQPPASQP